MADLANKSLQAQIKEVALEIAKHDRDIISSVPGIVALLMVIVVCYNSLHP
jgi:hypothetical protein